MNLKIEKEQAGNDYIIKLTGEIDVYTANQVNEEILPLTEAENNTIQIDLKQTTYLDSTGLGTFIAVYKSAEAHGSKLSLINAKDSVLRLFKITGLDEIIDVRGIDEVSELHE